MSERISKINLYFLNCCSLEIFENVYENGIITNFTVEFQKRLDINNFQEKVLEIKQKILEIYNCEVEEIYLMDSNYLVNHFYTQEGKEFFNEMRLVAQNQGENIFITDSNSYQELEKMNFSKDRAHFIADFNNFNDEYQFMHNISKCFDNNIFIAWNIRSFEDILSCKCYYDPFSGAKIVQSRDCFGNSVHHNVTSVRSFMEYGLTQTIYLINAGFLNRERFVQKKIPAWPLNIESCMFSKGIILRYGLFPEILFTKEGNTEYVFKIQEMFCESADYRYQVTDLMVRVIVKLCSNVGLATGFTDYRDVNLNSNLQKILKKYCS